MTPAAVAGSANRLPNRRCGHIELEYGHRGECDRRHPGTQGQSQREDGEAITVTKHGRPVARIVSAATPPHLAALVADGTVRPSEGSQPLPKPAKLRGSGKSASDYISEGRR
jgi:antitoxin (DNA-binding transcriptional repressor) of toxin-antitoxin stability system